MTVEERRRRRFTKDFHKEQVALIRSGEISAKEISILYEVKVESVKRWIRKYDPSLLPPQIVISNGSEVGRIKTLEEEIKNLKQIIADQQIELVSNGALLKVAKEKLGDSFEKK